MYPIEKKLWILYIDSVNDAREVNQNIVCKWDFLDPITVQFSGNAYIPNWSRVTSKMQLIKQNFDYHWQKTGSLGSSIDCCHKSDPNNCKGIHLCPNEARAEVQISNCRFFSSFDYLLKKTGGRK